ncbi:hypothetical protein NVP3058O_032 [Vibrio phage 3.058.O._10N.286.46.B8]|nr:hypothetical protein NVP2058O_033 [Vibrio phage 2.058.O._10N.286.46.B8]AUS03102.1 hypothetical protein NVP3058O_032 [Vibrio phage 3.058.O._10N.286.46.B8]
MKALLTLALIIASPFANSSVCDTYADIAELVMKYRQAGIEVNNEISRPQGSDLDSLIYSAYNWGVMDTEVEQAIAVAEFKHVMNAKCVKEARRTRQ